MESRVYHVSCLNLADLAKPCLAADDHLLMRVVWDSTRNARDLDGVKQNPIGSENEILGRYNGVKCKSSRLQS